MDFDKLARAADVIARIKRDGLSAAVKFAGHGNTMEIAEKYSPGCRIVFIRTADGFVFVPKFSDENINEKAILLIKDEETTRQLDQELTELNNKKR